MKENDIKSSLTEIEHFIRGDLAVMPKTAEACILKLESEIQSIKKQLREKLLHSDHAFEKNFIFVQATIQQLLAEGLDQSSSLKSSILGQQHLNECMNLLIGLLDDLQVQMRSILGLILKLRSYTYKRDSGR